MLGGLCALGILMLAWLDFGENPRSYFATYDHAKSSGIMDRGWIPTFIPRSSLDIHETHNIDTNAVKMSFQYIVGDSKEVEDNCKKIEVTKAGAKWTCGYYENKVIVELNTDGSAILESHRE